MELGNFSIKRKLIAIITLTSTAALVLACTALIAYNWINSKEEMNQNAVTLAEIIGANSVSALEFDDRRTARETLEGLAADPQIVAACIYAADGQTLAHYLRAGYEAPPPDAGQGDSSRFGDDYLEVFRQIRFDGERIGSVYLQVDLAAMYARLERYIQIVVIATALAMAAALAIGALLQRVISQPVLQLAQAAQSVSSERDYSVRVEKTTKDEIGSLIDSFNDMLVQIQIRDEAVRTELGERRRAEENMRRSERYYRSLIENGSDVILVIGEAGEVRYVSPSVERIFGHSPETLVGCPYIESVHAADAGRVAELFETVKRQKGQLRDGEFRLVDAAGDWRAVQAVFNNRLHDEAVEGVVVNIQDVTERQQVQEQLVQAHKMESIGQLAAGVAHEINTPMQFIGDNTYFLKEGLESLRQAVEAYSGLLARVKAGETLPPEAFAEIEERIEQLDLEYILEKTPEALDESLDGVRRVSQIIQAMRVFAHPGSDEKEEVDINQVVESAATVSRNEWKYVADLQLELDPSLPKVNCLPNDMSRVVVNLVVNAAHAITDVVGESGAKGRIRVGTRQLGAWVEISVGDSGRGIPAAVRPHVFNPFFTTKEVGKGTGQGLAIAHDVVVNKHVGELAFDSEEGEGTTFYIRLPLVADDAVQLNEEQIA